MTSIFDMLFGKQSRPVRRDVHLRPTVDADGNPIIETTAGESVTLSPEGSIDRAIVKPDHFYHCGCNAENPLGGKCGEPSCNRVSCAVCFTFCRCAMCSKPLCLEHAREDGKCKGKMYCLSCHGKLNRKRLARRVLSPFVDFEARTQ